MADTGEQSANLSVAEAERLAPGLLARQTKQTRQHWKRRGVPWDVIGPILLARLPQIDSRVRQSPDGGAPARPVHSASDRPTLVLPEESMKRGTPDAELIVVWQRVIAVYRARRKNPKKWQALTSNLDSWMEPPVKEEPALIRESDGTIRHAETK